MKINLVITEPCGEQTADICNADGEPIAAQLRYIDSRIASVDVPDGYCIAIVKRPSKAKAHETMPAHGQSHAR